MKLNEIPGDPTLKRKPKRRGRGHGSGLGKTAGRGHKGIQARSGGHKINRGFEGGQMPLQRRLPKRGFSNTAFATPHQVVNIAALNAFGDGATVDAEALRARRIARRCLPVKVLGAGELKVKNLTVEAAGFSASARRAIEAAGGRCVLAEAKPKTGREA